MELKVLLMMNARSRRVRVGEARLLLLVNKRSKRGSSRRVRESMVLLNRSTKVFLKPGVFFLDEEYFFI